MTRYTVVNPFIREFNLIDELDRYLGDEGPQTGGLHTPEARSGPGGKKF